MRPAVCHSDLHLLHRAKVTVSPIRVIWLLVVPTDKWMMCRKMLNVWTPPAAIRLEVSNSVNSGCEYDNNLRSYDHVSEHRYVHSMMVRNSQPLELVVVASIRQFNALVGHCTM